MASGDLDARVNAPGHDEVAALGAAIDRMADALQERIEREQRFVADVAHDLRTPLTGLKAAASLLEPDQVGLAVRDRVDRLQTLVEDLLEIARLESGSATADLRWVDLGKFVEQVVARPGVTVEAETTPKVWLIPGGWSGCSRPGSQRAVPRGPPVQATVVPGSIAARDHGPGFSEDMPVRATERFARTTSVRGSGFGLGLAIASAQSQLLGGRLELANANGGGALATGGAATAMTRTLLPALVVLAIAAGCGQQTGLRLENGGKTVPTVPDTTSPAPPSEGSISHGVVLGPEADLAYDDGTVWAAVWAGGPSLLGSLVQIDATTGSVVGKPRELPRPTRPICWRSAPARSGLPPGARSGASTLWTAT